MIACFSMSSRVCGPISRRQGAYFFKAGGKGFGKVLGLNIAALAENKTIFNDVFQLAYIAGVIIAHEDSQGAAGNADDVLALLGTVFFDEMLNEQRDVFFALR
jgi:hypothetical protein